MKQVVLTENTRAALLQIFRNTDDRRVRNRSQAILLSARGDSRPAVADALGVKPNCITTWVKNWLKSGIESLYPKKAPGKNRIVPESIASQIVEWVRGGPEAAGVDRANWTYVELAHRLYFVHGIRVSEPTMRRICHRNNIRPYRPTYRFLRADSEKQHAAAKELVALKK